jgi:hypothetical protein
MRLLTGNKRAYSVGGQARFKNPVVTEPTPRTWAALAPSAPPVVEARTMFPSRVFDASERNQVLIEGINNAKTGNQIMVGPWAGMRHYNLSLEERATCPRSCACWAECFGNGMPMAVRFRYNPALMMSLDGELEWLSIRHPKGFSVRLHILGDFPDLAYLRQWVEWSDALPELHVWGYTARPSDSAIGKEIMAMNVRRPGRWQVRFSVAEDTPYAPMQVATTWKKPERYAFDPATKSLICPQEIGKTDHCSTCGICWNPKLAHVRVRFLGHGNVNGKRSGRPAKTHAKYARPIPEIRNTLPPLPSERFESVEAFIAARGVTRLPPAKARGL